MKLFLTALLFFSFGVLSQKEFNNYSTLKAEGKIPEDFSNLTSYKIQEDLGANNRNLSKSQEKVFLEGIHYGIDQLLHSGMVIYGDEISLYIKSVADKLLQNEYSYLKNKLRFYTIKSNESNALSTDQGIVFVTTGLISQLTSEAQLAFVLAHEIAHYKEKHVVEAFEYRNQKNRNTIKQLSVYSKEKELFADKIGIEIYNAAGYAESELLSSFDVLMYSYLPFEEVTFPIDYFNSNLLYCPDFLFPSKKYDIQAVEDYDDSNSSHPNIKTRKSEAQLVIDEYRNWGKIIYFLGHEKFKYIRNICRFESVRTDILEANFADALYSIFILEREFPNSIYLKRMKAHSWLGIAQYKSEGIINETVNRSSDLEGEIASVHYFIKKLNLEATLTISLRQISDINNITPDDEELAAIYSKLMLLVAQVDKFNIKNYSDLNFQEASQAKVMLSDSIQIKKELESLNKYERINRKKNYNDPTVFDSTKFYYYALTDLVADSVFKTNYYQLKDSLDQINKEIEKYDNLSYSERKKYDVEYNDSLSNNSLGDFILVEPSAVSYKKNRIDYDASNKIKYRFEEAINSACLSMGLSIYTINSDKLSEIGTTGFNERSLLTNLLLQYSQNNDVDMLPVDYTSLKEIEKNYGTSKIVFTIVEHSYHPQFSSNALWLIFYPPALLGYIPIPFMNGNHTELNLIVLDTKSGQIEKGVSLSFNEPITKLMLEARMYDVLKSFN